MKPSVIALLVFAFILSSCASNEIGNSKDVNPETVFIDYLVTADNEQDSISFMAQFRFAGENGTTLVLTKPSHISFDGADLQVDSSKFEGAYYKKNFYKEAFAGNHNIVFTDLNGKEHKESFEFHSIACADFPPAINRTKQFIRFTGAEEGDKADITISDTAFTKDDIEMKDVNIAKPVSITQEQLQQLSSGPIQIEIKQYKNLPLKNATGEGGRLQIVYYIKRISAELRDNTVAIK